jgi:hypothetical protein
VCVCVCVCVCYVCYLFFVMSTVFMSRNRLDACYSRPY